MIGFIALMAGFPQLGGSVGDDSLFFRARIDCDVRSEDGTSRISFLFPGTDLEVDGQPNSDTSEEPGFAVMVLRTVSDGRSFLEWASASAVPPELEGQTRASNVPAIPVLMPPIAIQPFHLLTPRSSDGSRWSYSGTSFTTDGGPTFHYRGNCKLTNSVVDL